MPKCSPALAALFAISFLLTTCGAASHPYECSDPLGCLEIPPGSPVVIGTILATSGDNASIGLDSQRGVDLAVEEKDNILGHPISLSRYGTDCSVGSARTAAAELVTDPDLLAIIGPTCDAEALVIAPILAQAGLVLITPSAESPTSSAHDAALEFFRTIEQVAVHDPNGTLFIPREGLRQALSVAILANPSFLGPIVILDTTDQFVNYLNNQF